MSGQTVGRAIGALLCSFVLAACGGGLGSDAASTTGGGTSGGTTVAVYRAGTLSGSTFSNGQIFVATPDLDAGGQTSLRVDIVDENGAPAFGISATVTFNSTCVGASRAEVSPASVTTTSGSATATYIAKGCVGSDTVVAQVVLSDTTTLVATGSVEIQAAALGSIDFVSATPNVIGLSGSPITNQSVVVFKVVDASGGPVSGQLVNFSLDTTPGGLKLNPSSATSDAQGQVQTVIEGGSAHATVAVIATVGGDSGTVLSKASSPIVVTTGLATSRGVSVSASKLSIDGSCDGESTTVSVRLADRYGNPVPKNTAPTLVTEGGKINGSCVTGDPQGDPNTEAGVCSVLLVAQNPRPANGRVTVLASVVGEESFTDTNGNGYFDVGEPFIDLPEAFEDDNENGVYDNGEYFFDANGNGIHDGPDGKFEGYVCDSPGVNCKTTLTTVSNSPPNSPLVIVFSQRSPSIAPSDLTVGVNVSDGSSYDATNGKLILKTANTIVPVTIVVRDANFNPMPSGTTFTLKTTSGTVLDPATIGPYNINDPSPQANLQAFNFQAPAAALTGSNNGLVSLTVTVPAGTCSGATATSVPLFTFASP